MKLKVLNKKINRIYINKFISFFIYEKVCDYIFIFKIIIIKILIFFIFSNKINYTF